MKHLTIVGLFTVALLSMAADCDSRQTSCKNYQGDLMATEPYDATPTISVVNTVLARVGLHNPTGDNYTVDVECTFFLDDWQDVDNPGQHTADVCPDSSVYVEIEWAGDFGVANEAGATCIAVWNLTP